MTAPSRRLRLWLWRQLLMLLATTIAVLALTPVPPEQASLGWDKLNHLAAFAALAWCAMFGYRSSSHGVRLAVLLALLAFGAAIELLQLLVPRRSAEWADLLADGSGLVVGALLALWWLRSRRDPAR